MAKGVAEPSPPMTSYDLKSIVLFADGANYVQDAYYPVQYEFNNGRQFRRRLYPGEAYAWIE